MERAGCLCASSAATGSGSISDRRDRGRTACERPCRLRSTSCARPDRQSRALRQDQRLKLASQKPAVGAPLARAPCRRAHSPVVTQARELALADRVVAFAAGSLTLAPCQLDQPALIEPRGGAFMHHGGSLIGRGPFVRRFEHKHRGTLTHQQQTPPTPRMGDGPHRHATARPIACPCDA
jgi:hypothetical protein